MSQDIAERALNLLEAKLPRLLKCIEAYLEKGNGKLNNTTVVAIFRSIESEVIREVGLPETTFMHNMLRQHALNKALDEDSVHN